MTVGVWETPRVQLAVMDAVRIEALRERVEKPIIFPPCEGTEALELIVSQQN